jgi:hypothetical protein
MNYLIALLIMLSLLFVAPFPVNAAASFRCGGRIIDVGQSRDFVFHKCGQPTNIEERTERFGTNFIQRYPEDHERYNYIINKNQIEVWTYNLGPTQFVRYLTFKNGKLIDIKTGDYGY